MVLSAFDIEIDSDQVGRVIGVDEADKRLRTGAVEHPIGAAGANDVVLAGADKALGIRSFHAGRDSGPALRTACSGGKGPYQCLVGHDAGDRADRSRDVRLLRTVIEVGVDGYVLVYSELQGARGNGSWGRRG